MAVASSRSRYSGNLAITSPSSFIDASNSPSVQGPVVADSAQAFPPAVYCPRFAPTLLCARTRVSTDSAMSFTERRRFREPAFSSEAFACAAAISAAMSSSAFRLITASPAPRALPTAYSIASLMPVMSLSSRVTSRATFFARGSSSPCTPCIMPLASTNKRCASIRSRADSLSFDNCISPAMPWRTLYCRPRTTACTLLAAPFSTACSAARAARLASNCPRADLLRAAHWSLIAAKSFFLPILVV